MSAKRKKESADPNAKTIALNRRASFDFEIGQRYEAGVVLMGSEVKALRHAAANIAEAWVTVRGGEAFVEGMRIPILKHAAFGHLDDRTRKLLLHQREIDALQSEIDRKGMTVIVTRIYFRDGLVKLELGVARGRRMADKREVIKGREAAQEARAAMDRARRGKG